MSKLNRRAVLRLIFAAAIFIPPSSAHAHDEKRVEKALAKVEAALKACRYTRTDKIRDGREVTFIKSFSVVGLSDDTLTLEYISSIRGEREYLIHEESFDVTIPLTAIASIQSQSPDHPPNSIGLMAQDGEKLFRQTFASIDTYVGFDPPIWFKGPHRPAAINEFWLYSFPNAKITQNAKNALEALVKAAKDKQ